MIMFQLFLTLNLVRIQNDLAKISTETALKSFIHLKIWLAEGMVRSFICFYNFICNK